MKVFQVKNKNVLENWSNKVNKDGILEYFTKEFGYKKTKKFSFVEVSFPENPSWLEVVKINLQYGEDVALEFANQKTAGIVAWAYLNAKTLMYQKSKQYWDGIETSLANRLFEKFAIQDYFLSLCGVGSLDIIKLDEILHKEDKEYDPLAYTYRGKPTSTMEYIKIKYGHNIALALEAMI